MKEWNHDGEQTIRYIDTILCCPKELLEEYIEYLEVFKGAGFLLSFADFINIQKALGLIRIAENIGNFPELFSHYSVTQPPTEQAKATYDGLNLIAEAILNLNGENI